MRNSRVTYISQCILYFIISGVTWQACDTENNLGPDYKNYFVRLFGEEGNQEGVDLIVNEADESVVLLGTTSEPNGSKRLFLVKADWEGTLIWKKKLGGPGDVAKDIELANDGGYIILSESTDALAEDPTENIKLMKVTFDGDKVDSVLYGTEGNGIFGVDQPKTVTPMEDSYIVTGSTNFPKTQGDEGLSVVRYLMVKFSSDLVPDNIFNKDISQAEFSAGIKTFRTSADRIYMLGSDNNLITTQNGVNYNFWYFGFEYLGGDPAGGYGWIGIDKQGEDEMLSTVCPSFGSGFFLVGVHTDGSGSRDIYTTQVANDNGELTRKDTIGYKLAIPINQNRRIVPTSVCRADVGQRGYLILGTEGEEGEHNIWLSKVDITGETVYWSSLFGAADRNDDRAGTVAELPDGRILVVGTVNVGVSNLKMGLFKINADGKFSN
jgi:hypothetical protein